MQLTKAAMFKVIVRKDWNKKNVNSISVEHSPCYKVRKVLNISETKLSGQGTKILSAPRMLIFGLLALSIKTELSKLRT